MAYYTDMVNIADAIREKTGVNRKLYLDEMAVYLDMADAELEDEEIDSILDGSIKNFILPQEQVGIVIQDRSFQNSTELTSVDVTGATKLGNYCFDGCSSLSEIAMTTVTSLGKYCFAGCTSLTGFDTANFTSLPSHCFDGCSSLSEIDLSNLITISPNCFTNCGDCVFSDVNDEVIIYAEAFSLCNNLPPRTDWSNIKLNRRAFARNKITKIDGWFLPHPNNSDYAEYFDDCTYLTEAKITVLEYNSNYCYFNDCSNLEKVDITSESLNSFTTGTLTSKPLSSLKTIIIDNVRDFYYIGTKFPNLTNLIIKSSSIAALKHSDSLDNTLIGIGEGKIYVPADLVAQYKIETNWAQYADQIVSIEEWIE